MNDSLRLRLEALNRGPLPAPKVTASVAKPRAPLKASSKASSKASPKAKRRSATQRATRPGQVPPLPGLVRRGEAVSNECGEHLLIQIPLETLWPGGEQLVRRRAAHLSDGGTEEAFAAGFPSNQLLLDLETCGLSGCPLFLVGLLREVEGQLAVELLLARDYSEEAAVLKSLWQRITPETVLATYNGKSFDWPMVQDRTIRHRLFIGEQPPRPVHVDFLHLARRRWRGQFADCKLQTLERNVCGRLRTDDIPGSQIPAAYEQYVRTGFEREMDSILLHNAIDLVTLLDLGMRLVA